MSGARNDLIHAETVHAAHQTVCQTLRAMAETDLLRIVPATGQKGLPKIFLNLDGSSLLSTVLSDYQITPRVLGDIEVGSILTTHKIDSYIYTVNAGIFSHMSPEDNAPVFEGGLAEACGGYENFIEAIKDAKELDKREVQSQPDLPPR